MKTILNEDEIKRAIVFYMAHFIGIKIDTIDLYIGIDEDLFAEFDLPQQKAEIEYDPLFDELEQQPDQAETERLRHSERKNPVEYCRRNLEKLVKENKIIAARKFDHVGAIG